MKSKNKDRLVGLALIASAATAIYLGGLPLAVGIVVGLGNGAYIAGMAVSFVERK